MSVRDHVGVVLDKFNGLWQRGDADTTPIDYFSDCQNIDFVGDSSFKTRPGIVISQTVDVPLRNIKRIYNYPTQQANTLIILAVDENTGIGSIYHVLDSNTVYGPLLSIQGMNDFAFVPFYGRGYISPFTQGLPILAPPNALIAAIASGAGLGVGVYNYATTFVNAAGETNPSPLTAVTTIAALTNPVVAPVATDVGIINATSNLVPTDTYKWKVTYVRNGKETAAGPASAGFVAPANTHFIGINATIIPASGQFNLYRTIGNGATYYQEVVSSQGYTVYNVGGVNYIVVGQITDASIVADPTAPAANATQQQQVSLTSIPTDPTGQATSRNIYRTAVGVSQLQLLHTLADNTTTTYTDSTADVSLGADAPTVNTAYIGSVLVEKGMSGQYVYVYAGDGTAARKAAGIGMTGTMTIGYGLGGFMDLGIHIFGIVSQTISGYNAPPSVFTLFNTAASNSLSFSNIPTSGDPNTVIRLLVATKAIDPAVYDGNLAGYQFFFVPGAVINNNTDTFLNNISFYDADLLEDASELLNNYTAIPAGAVLSSYHNRLIVAATATDISLALISNPGEPEAIDQITGLIVVPLDGNPITNAQEFRDVLYMFKRTKTSAYIDNGDTPSTWSEVIIDSSLGTCVHGVATSLDSGKAAVDNLIIATFQGISMFNGRYVTPELTWKIYNLWNTLNQVQFGLIQMVNEPITKKLYVVLPDRQLLVGDYTNGMDWKNIRWCPWTFNTSPSNPGISTVAVFDVNSVVLGADLL